MFNSKWCKQFNMSNFFFLQNERGIFKLNVSLDNCIFIIREFSAHLHNYLNAGIITWLTLNHMT